MRLAPVLRAVGTAVLIFLTMPKSFADDFRPGGVVPNMPPPSGPIVTLVTPTSNATVFGLVTLTAIVDLRGTPLSSLRYEVDGVAVSTCPGGVVCSASWDSSKAAVGPHWVIAKATNTAGETGQSALVRVVIPAPVVTFVEPLPSAIAVGKVTLRASVELHGRALDTLSYQVDGTIVGTCNSGEICGFPWDTTTVMPGWHALVAIAKETGGASGRSTTIFVRTTVPTVRSIELQYGGYFLKNTDIVNETSARVTWDGHKPGTVEFKIGDRTSSIVTANDQGATFDLPMDEFPASRQPSVLRVRAKTVDNLESEELKKDVWVFEYPQWIHDALRRGGSLTARAGTNEILYAIEAKYPEPPLGANSKVQIPSWIPFLGGRMGMQETYATINGEVSSRGEGGLTLSGRTGFEVGGVSIGGAVNGSGAFRMGTPRGLTLTGATFGFQFAGGYERSVSVKDAIPGVNRLKRLPVVGPGIAKFVDNAELRGEVEASLGFGAVFSQDELSSELEFREGTGTIGLDLQGGLNVKVSDRVAAELFVGGNGAVTIGVPERNGHLMRDLSAGLQGGVNLTLDGLLSVSAKASYTVTCAFAGGGATCDADVLEASDDVASVPVRLIAAPSQEQALVDAQGAEAAITNVFRNAKPSVVALPDGPLVLWTAQNPSLPVMQSTEIAWMRFNGTSWSTPSVVEGDSRVDLSPLAAMDRSHRVVAAWLRVKDPAFALNGGSNDLARYYAQFEVVSATFDPATNRWSRVTTLTNDERFDTDLRLVHDRGGRIMLTWLSFDDALRATLRASFWSGSTWSTPTAISTGLTGASRHAAAIDGDAAFVVLSRDPDPDVDGDAVLDVYRWNGIVWSAVTPFASGGADHGFPAAAYDTSRMGHVLWLQGTELMHATLQSPTPHVVRQSTSSTEVAELVVVPDGSGHFTLLWPESKRTGATTLTTSDFDPVARLESDALALSDGEGIAGQAAASVDAGGALRIAYVSTKLGLREQTVVVDGKSVTIANLPAAGPSDLRIMEHASLTDLVLRDDDLTLDPPDPGPGVQTIAYIDVHNAGHLPATSFAVALYSGLPERGGTILGFAMIDALEGGAARTVALPFVNPGNRSLVGIVDAGGTVREHDETNNRAIIVRSKRRAIEPGGGTPPGPPASALRQRRPLQ